MRFGQNTRRMLHKVDLSYSVERAYLELNFYEVNMKTKLLLDDNSIDTLRRLKEINEYSKVNPQIPYRIIFKRIMNRVSPRLIKTNKTD